MTIGILGGQGMLGSDLVNFFSGEFEVDAIDKDNYNDFLGEKYDVLINANGNSRRFWANQNPQEDFEASTVSVHRSLFDFQYGKYVYISSPDVYENPGDPSRAKEDVTINSKALSPYGFHKYLSERIVEHYAADYLIIRPAALLGKKLKKGPVYDILQDEPCFITADSKIQFVGTTEIARVIKALIEKGVKNEIFNVAGKDPVSAEKIAELAGKKFSARSDAEPQRYEMNGEKISRVFPIKASEEYLKEFLSGL